MVRYDCTVALLVVVVVVWLLLTDFDDGVVDLSRRPTRLILDL